MLLNASSGATEEIFNYLHKLARLLYNILYGNLANLC